MLTLEIEFLSGTCYAASERDTSVPEWPPQPDRLFSALVAAWGARGADPREQKALEWLETQPPEGLVHAICEKRTSVDVFVPTNDARTGRDGNLHVLPTARSRQPRRFPAARLDDPILRAVWRTEPDEATLEMLDAIARDVLYVGHSASLVRARFLRDDVPVHEIRRARRAPYPGRLAELQRAYERGVRPSRGMAVPPANTASAVVPSGVFDANWVVLPGVGGSFTPDVRASAFVTKRMRDALMSAFGASKVPVPEWISGHAPDGSPTRLPHVAVIPMLDVGHQYAESNLMGVAIVPPRGVPHADRTIIDALVRLRDPAMKNPPGMRLIFAQGDWKLAFTDDDARVSLRPARWCSAKGARRWATATPIVLDRYPHERRAAERQAEVESLVAGALANVGFPAPTAVVANKHSAVQGAIAAYPSGGAPSWMRWKITDALGRRMLTHAVIEFQEPVVGPLILGAGRFVGLGLCLPLKDDDDV